MDARTLYLDPVYDPDMLDELAEWAEQEDYRPHPGVVQNARELAERFEVPFDTTPDGAVLLDGARHDDVYKALDWLEELAEEAAAA